MATITYALKDLAEYGIKKEILPQLVDALGMSVESLDDEEAVIDITPNRPDLLDIVGFARALYSFVGKMVPDEKRYLVENEPAMEIVVGKAVKAVRPFIVAMVARNVDLSGDKLKYMINFTEKLCETYGRKRKKLAMGLHNLDVVKGPLTYDAAHDKEFAPLGSKTDQTFSEILAGHSKGVEYGSIVTANNPKAVYPYLEDSEGVLSLIPIVNSERTRVKNSTKNLLVDITGPSKNAVMGALDLFACSLIDSGAEIYPCSIIYDKAALKTPSLGYREFRIKKFSIEKTLGVFIEEKVIIELANKMGLVAAKYGEYLLFNVPPYRLDILNEQDIIEDIAIAYGYDNINPLPVPGFAAGVQEDYREYANRISKLMVGLGFSEAMNMYLTNEKLNFESCMRKGDPSTVVGIAYAKTEAITMLRTSILPQLLQNLGQSAHERMPQRLFEIGSTFEVVKGKVGERVRLGFVSEHSRANFAEVRSVVDSVLKYYASGKYAIKEMDDPAFIKGRCAAIVAGTETVGVFGEIAPQVLGNFKLEEPVIAAEIRMSALRGRQQQT